MEIKRSFFRFCSLWLLSGAALSLLIGCSVNPATGRTQFTGLMSPQQEQQIGAQEHEKIRQQFGFYEDAEMVAYVRDVGDRIAQDTERPDVQYKFYVLDSPIVNAFALPGGYVYVSRGLLALANSEAELAAVLSHEVAHITARHSAERYSTGVVTSLGASVLSAALDAPGASQALGLGANLYLKSYSRDQENESDTLGLRYMTQAGYDPRAMASFLESLKDQAALEQRLEGRSSAPEISYFSTHPATGDRVQKTMAEAGQYAQSGKVERDAYLSKIDGMIYGESPKQGFIRGRSFLHPELGFRFDVPEGYRLINQSSQVIAVSRDGGAMIFDLGMRQAGQNAADYLVQDWMRGEPLQNVETISVNGMPAATASFAGQVDGQPVVIRLVAVEWGTNRFARFQIAIPRQASPAMVEGLKRATYSFNALSDQERRTLLPHRLRIVTAGVSETVASLAGRMPFDQLREERFRVLNALTMQEGLRTGSQYKIVQ